MTQPIVDRRFVLNPDEEGMELRLAVSRGSLHVVGIRGGKLAFLDELSEGALRTIGAGEQVVAAIKAAGSEPRAVFAAVPDAAYARLICPDPQNLGKVETSTDLGPFQVVGPEQV